MDDILCQLCCSRLATVVCEYTVLWSVLKDPCVYNSVKGIADIYWIKGMGYAGTAGMVWGWIIAMIFIQCIAMSMAELCSAMPTRYDTFSNICKKLGLKEC